MSRALYRGLSTPERIRPQPPDDESGSPTKVREEQRNDRPRSRPFWETCFPHSMRRWIKQKLSFSSSFHKQGLKLFDAGSKSGKISDSPGSLSFHSSSPTSVSSNGCGGRDFSFLSSCEGFCSYLPFFLIFLVGVFVVITVTGLNRTIPVVFPPHNLRGAQILAWRELFRGGMLGRGSMVSIPREVTICPNGMEDYIPCYNVTANLNAGYKNGLEFESHCEVSEKWECLVRPPKDYRTLLKWPGSRQGIWRGNLQIDEATGGDRFLVEEESLKFPDKEHQFVNGVGIYVQQVSAMLNLSGVTDFSQAGIRSVLDIGCGLGSLGAHLFAHDLLTMCIAPYEEHGGQVQITLERGLPAMVRSFVLTQLPYPSSSYDLIHCAKCGIEGHPEDAMTLFEIDRLLRVGGYFVLATDARQTEEEQTLKSFQNITSILGWKMSMPFQQDLLIVIWQKLTPQFLSMKHKIGSTLCEQSASDGHLAWHQPLRQCITLAPAYRRISVQDQLVWPSRLQLASADFVKPGSEQEEKTSDLRIWNGAIAEYWSLFTPIIFSDHPKRLGDEDSSPPSNIVRNVMDLNAGYGAFNAALISSGKPLWVMNVVPTSAPDTLSFIFDRGLIGTVHDWCEPFPTYPRTYDFLHATHLLSQELGRKNSCGLKTLFFEMDRILRPEGWVFLLDEAALIEDARAATNQLRWESRVVEVTGDSKQRLLVCQKTFWKA